MYLYRPWSVTELRELGKGFSDMRGLSNFLRDLQLAINANIPTFIDLNQGLEGELQPGMLRKLKA